jgi:cobalamin synthase
VGAAPCYRPSVKALAGLLALMAFAAVVALLVVLFRDAMRDRHEDTMFEPARRRRRLVLVSLLLTILLPAIGSQRGLGVAVAGLAVAAAWWAYVAVLLRRLRTRERLHRPADGP